MYRTIDTAIWNHEKIKSLDTATKLFALYLVTNIHTHLCGIYYLPTVTSAYEIGLMNSVVKKAYLTLEEKQFAYFDPKTDVVFVKKMFSRQGRGEKNRIAAATHLTTLNKTGLIRQFLRQYPEVVQYLPEGFWGYPIDGVSDTLSETPVPILIPNPTLKSPDQMTDSCAFAFEVWLGHDNLIHHRTLSRKMRSSFNARIKDGYASKDITRAIDRYAVLEEKGTAPGFGQWGFSELLNRDGGGWIDKLNDHKFKGFVGKDGPKKTEAERAAEIDEIERGLK